MNKDKLESLRRLAADERTPVEEARNAALAFVRGGGQAEDLPSREEITNARALLAEATRERDNARSRASSLEVVVERERSGRQKAEQEAARLRSILTRLMDARKAEELAGKVRAQAEQEAREALGGEDKRDARETHEPITGFAKKPAGQTMSQDEWIAANPWFRRGREF